MPRLSDTAAISRRPLKSAYTRVAGDNWAAPPCAEEAVTGPRPGQFRRETGAGQSDLACAVRTASGEYEE